DGLVQTEVSEILSILGGTQGREKTASPVTEQESENAAKKTEQNALGQQLTYQPASPGTQRDANGDFLTADCGASKQQISHIGTGDEEHEYHNRHQKCGSEHQPLAFRTVRGHGQGPDNDALALIGVRVLVFQGRCIDLHLRLGLGEGDASAK